MHAFFSLAGVRHLELVCIVAYIHSLPRIIAESYSVVLSLFIIAVGLVGFDGMLR